MIPKYKAALIFFFLGLFVLACTSEQEEKIEELPLEENPIEDTLFGELTDKQQYYQHFILRVPSELQSNIDSLINWLIVTQPGGIAFSDWEPDSVLKVRKRLDTAHVISPLFYTGYFDFLDLPQYPYWDASDANRDLNWARVFQYSGYGIVGFEQSQHWSENGEKWLVEWEDSLGIALIPHYYKDENVRRDYEHFVNRINASDEIISLELNLFDTVSLNTIRKQYSFTGVFSVDVDIEAVNKQLAGGADWIWLNLDQTEPLERGFEKWLSMEKNSANYQESTDRILRIKKRQLNAQPVNDADEARMYTRLNLISHSTVVFNEAGSFLPLNDKSTIYASKPMKITANIREENQIRVRQKIEELSEIEKIIAADGKKVILLSDTTQTEIIDRLAKTNSDDNLLICFSNPEHYKNLSTAPYLAYYNKATDNYDLLVQQITGQLAILGDFPMQDSIIKGERMDKYKLARTPPTFCGLNKDTLRKIDYAVKSAIGGRAFPGCQVLIAKNGCIVYDKSFGHHTYDRVTPVESNSLYDLASLTKVVSTTLMGMKLYEMEAYKLQDSLKDYLPDTLKDYLPFPNTIKNISFQELFIHKSGLPAGFPILDYIQYTSDEIGRFDKYYCDLDDSIYHIEVAENFYLDLTYRDSMWLKLNQIWIDKSKPYKYSDVNMNTLYFMFKSLIHNDPEKFNFDLTREEKENPDKDLYVEFLYNAFYNPLGMEHSRYKPLQYFTPEEVVPTENDRYWRKQLLRGHVHDPNAALYGGIAGNAGMFSTANDLAILAQMLVQGGVYNGVRYLKKETVNKFTSVQPDSHRGLGFNKPSALMSAFGSADSAPVSTYGHTGFTGTCIWIDPESELTYIFLSNRVHPTVNNRIYQYGIRSRVHQFAYDARIYGD